MKNARILALALTIASIPAAEASVAYFTPSGIGTVAQNTPLYWDMLSSATSTSSLGAVGDLNLSDHGDFHFDSTSDIATSGGDGGYVLAPGSLVGASLNFDVNNDFAGTTDYGGTISLDVPSYYGVRFVTGGNTYYGWVQITESATTQTIHGWAYETSPNTPIAAGAIPEPSAVLLSLSGLAAAGLLRKRRN